MKMRAILRPLLLVVLVGLTGAACASGSAGKGTSSAVSSSAPSSSGFCAQLKDALTNVSGLAGKANDLSAYKSTVAAYAAAFDSLANRAPQSIKGALSDMATALHTLSSTLNGGGSSELGALSRIAPRVTTDGQQLGQYVAANCAGA